MKILCYGVRSNERPYFEKLNKYNFDLKLTDEFLNENNANLAQGCDAVLLRGNCLANRNNLKYFSEDCGIKYVFTRSIGFNHIDLKAAKDYNIQVARVPNYSPYSVAELAMTLGMQLFRHTNLATTNSAKGDFEVVPELFSKEIHSSIVGIIGAGKIGLTEAKLYRGMGAKVLAYDPFPNKAAEEIVEFRDLDEVLANSDIVSIHIPYLPGKNENFVNVDFLKKMKKSAVLVNTARGEIVDTKAVINAVENGEIEGYAADVIVDEKDTMGKKFTSIDEIPDSEVRALVKLYPKVLLTPHIGSFTEPALEGMISISFDNFHKSFTTGSNPNIIEYQEK